MSTGMPAGIWLTKFGVIVHDYFGHRPYHVGSSLDRKDWRDVDVRLILPDEEFEALFGENLSSGTNPKLAAITLAFATLGQQMTGLPVDFQIQPQTWANEHYDGPRSALLEVRPDGHAALAALDLDARDARVRAEAYGQGRDDEAAALPMRYDPSSAPVDAPSRPTGTPGPCCTDAFDSEGNAHDPGCLYLLGLAAGRTAAAADIRAADTTDLDGYWGEMAARIAEGKTDD